MPLAAQQLPSCCHQFLSAVIHKHLIKLCQCSLEAYAQLMNDCATHLLQRLHVAASEDQEMDIWQALHILATPLC